MLNNDTNEYDKATPLKRCALGRFEIIPFFFSCLLFTALSAPAAITDDYAFAEYEIKAGFIYRFLSFVTWPNAAESDDEIRIGILGKNPFGAAFDSIDGRRVGDRTVRVLYFPSETALADLTNSHVLFVSSSEQSRVATILGVLENHPVLTIGDVAGFVDAGGMIGFVMKSDGEIGIALNLASMRKVNLQVRSMLKRIAERIVDEVRHEPSD